MKKRDRVFSCFLRFLRFFTLFHKKSKCWFFTQRKIAGHNLMWPRISRTCQIYEKSEKLFLKFFSLFGKIMCDKKWPLILFRIFCAFVFLPFFVTKSAKMRKGHFLRISTMEFSEIFLKFRTNAFFVLKMYQKCL